MEPVKFEFKVPEALKETVQFKTDDPSYAEFNTALGDAALSPQQRGEKLLDLYAKVRQADAAQTLANQHRVFNETRQGWVKEAMADPQIGGSGHRTAMRVVARTRDWSISDAQPGTPEYAADAKAYDEMLRTTGVGDHPIYLKQLHRIGRRFDEPALPPDNIRPPKDNGKAPRGVGRNPLYDNPRSNPNRQ